MNEAIMILEAAENYFDETQYDDFLYNTIKTIGYNSNTYELLSNVKKSIKVDKYEEEITSNINDCAKINGKDSDISFKSNFEELEQDALNYISKEEFDGIMFDENVQIVDDYINYNRIQGIEVKDNIKEYLEDFKSGVELIFTNDDYEYIKEDIYNECGLLLNELNDLEKDTAVGEETKLDEDELSNDKNLILENEKEMNM